MCNLKKYLLILLLLFSYRAKPLGSLDTTLAGTDKSLVVANNWTFDSTPGTYCKGFVSFQNGFTIAPTSTLLFESTVPVIGPINLNRGTLKLTNDLYLGRNASIVGPGWLDPNLHSIYLFDVESITGGTVYIMGPGTFVGNGNILNLDIAGGGALDFAGWPYGTMHNIRIRNASDSSFKTYFGNGCVFDTVTFELAEGTFFDFYWTLIVDGNCHVTGQGSTMRAHTYGAITIASTGSFVVDPQTTLRVSSGGIIFNAASSELMLDNANLEVAITMGFRNGRTVINGLSTIFSLAGCFIVLGDAVNESNDHLLFINPASTLVLASGLSIFYKNIK